MVVIATTSFLAAIADDVRDAVEAGSNVITTAEEAAYPWANDAATADRLDALARSRGVTILGAGLNPGFAFDALVLTACGVVPEVESLLVERVVDLSGFGETVLRRIGVGHSAESFEEGRRNGTVTGHIGFPQSMRVVAARLGVDDRADRPRARADLRRARARGELADGRAGRDRRASASAMSRSAAGHRGSRRSSPATSLRTRSARSRATRSPSGAVRRPASSPRRPA